MLQGVLTLCSFFACASNNLHPTRNAHFARGWHPCDLPDTGKLFQIRVSVFATEFRRSYEVRHKHVKLQEEVSPEQRWLAFPSFTEVGRTNRS